MKVVNISLDPKILDTETPAAMRAKAYGDMVDVYSVVVPTPAPMRVALSDSTTIYGVSGRNKIIQLYNIYRKLLELVRMGKCDVISSTDYYYIGVVALFLARRYHLGLEFSVLGIEKLTPLRKALARYVLRRASIVRALSSRINKRLTHEFGVPEDHIKVIPIYIPVSTLGFDTRTLDDSQLREYEAQTRDFKERYGRCFNFLYVGRLVPIKRHDLQITAIAALKNDHPDIRLHIVGDGLLRGELEAKVNNLGLKREVIFHGHKTGHALGMFYMECDCLLFTSDYEGWGMCAVEAAVAGMPVVMTDVGLAGEFIVDGKSGLIVPAGDVRALESAMEKIITDPDLRQALSLGTKEAVSTLQPFEEILKYYKENWQRALNNPL